MNGPKNLFVGAFRQHNLGFFMSVLLGIMVYFSALAMTGQALLSRAAQTWSGDLEGRFTVEIAWPQNSAPPTEEAALRALKNLSGVKTVARVDETEMRKLLRSWTGETDFANALPLPALFDVDMHSGSLLTEQALAHVLSPLGIPSGRLHPHVGQATSVLRVVQGLEGLALVIVILTGLAMISVVTIACHAVLSAQKDTLSLLRILGAENRTIANAFQHHVLAWSMPACGIGFGSAVVTLVCLFLAFGSVFDVFFSDTYTFAVVGLSMALVPVCAIGLSVMTVRFAVLSLLRRCA